MMLEATSGVTAGVAAAAYAVRGRSSTIFGPSVYHGDRRRKSVSLTFDDGPSESTPRILEILARHGAKATFFQCGMNAERLPGVAREAAAAGHEIGNHTYSHPRLWLQSASFVHNEVDRAQRVLADTHGASPRLFRAPYGVRWFGLRAVQERLNLLGVMWTTIALDWKLGASGISARVMRGLTPGAIFCLHDGRATQPNPDIQQTVEAVSRLVPDVLAKGYRFETVSQLLCPTT